MALASCETACFYGRQVVAEKVSKFHTAHDMCWVTEECVSYPGGWTLGWHGPTRSCHFLRSSTGEGETRSHECWLGYPWSQIAIRHGEDVRLLESTRSPLQEMWNAAISVAQPLLILRFFLWAHNKLEAMMLRAVPLKKNRGWAFPELSVSKILHFILFGLLLNSLVHLHKCFETSMFCTTCRALAERWFQLDSGDTCGYFCPPE